MTTKNTETGLDAEDCRTVAQALRVFTRLLRAECPTAASDGNVPTDVAAKAGRVEAWADQIARSDGLASGYESWLAAAERGEPFPALHVLTCGQWQAVVAVLDCLAGKVGRAGDTTNAARLADLRAGVAAVADWAQGFTAALDGLAAAAEAADLEASAAATDE